jgi:excinuclease ABC subunit C
MLLLEGRSREVRAALIGRMERAAAGERFEEAARLRDQIRAIEKTQERQQMVAHWGADQDVFGLYREGGAIEVQVLFVRDGKLVSNQAYPFDDRELPDAEVLEAVLTQFYQATAREVPDEILVPVAISDAPVRAEYLAERRGRKVLIVTPQRGDKLRLVEMAQANARRARRAPRRRREGTRQVLELQRRLGLRAPRRIECVDIATFQGRRDASVRWWPLAGGRPWKDGYRVSHIRCQSRAPTTSRRSPEVLRRRFRPGPRRTEPPTSLVIDGGLASSARQRRPSEALELGERRSGLAKARGARSVAARDPAPAGSRVPAGSQEPGDPALELDGAVSPAAGP